MSDITWSLKAIPIKDLVENPKNPRFISKEQNRLLTEIIDDFGLIDKPIVNLDNLLIGGHQRLKILKKMKIKTVECWVPDRLLTPEEIDRLCIALNLNQGFFDYEMLANNFDVTDLLSWGFTEDQLLGNLEQLIENIDEKEKSQSSKKTNCPACGHEF